MNQGEPGSGFLGGWGGDGGRGEEREGVVVVVNLHHCCHHQNDLCIKAGRDGSGC